MHSTINGSCMSVTAVFKVYHAHFKFTHGLFHADITVWQCSPSPLLSLSWQEAMDAMFIFTKTLECAHLKLRDGPSKQSYRHTRNAVLLVWGSLRLAIQCTSYIMLVYISWNCNQKTDIATNGLHQFRLSYLFSGVDCML